MNGYGNLKSSASLHGVNIISLVSHSNGGLDIRMGPNVGSNSGGYFEPVHCNEQSRIIGPHVGSLNDLTKPNSDLGSTGFVPDPNEFGLVLFGAYPVFVTDGTPSPLKSQARIMRFFQASGIDLSSLPVSNGTSVERNKKFTKCVQECVELLELFGMPVLRASGEAEGLCAQLNRDGHVDACVTSDSDAFLFGAKCIIKSIKPNSQEPFECYEMSDIEAGLGVKRKHMIAIALLVGNDHDLKGVQGIGLETALSFVKSFSEDEVLDKLCLLGSGNTLDKIYVGDGVHNLDENITRTRCSHCSLCGHPGSKRSHLKDSCERCSSIAGEGCVQKPVGFKCDCLSCDQGKKEKELKKNEAWQMRVCKKIAMEPNFPNDAIIQMYLSNNNSNFTDRLKVKKWPHVSEQNGFKLKLVAKTPRRSYCSWCVKNNPADDCKERDTNHEYGRLSATRVVNDSIVGHLQDVLDWPSSVFTSSLASLKRDQFEFILFSVLVLRYGEPFMSWKNPNTEMLIDYIAFKLSWEPSFTRQKLFPLLSTILLRNIAKHQVTELLYGQYEVDFIQRTKIRYGHTFYVVTWKKPAQAVDNNNYTTPFKEPQVLEDDDDELIIISDDSDVTNVRVGNGCLTTDENMDLVMAAYPEKVNQFMQQKEAKEAKSRKKARSKSALTLADPLSPTSRGVQLNITQFYRSSKGEPSESLKEKSSSVEKRNARSGNFSKSARRRLLFG
ncbi:flap endonuclease GEN-like 1 protein isoform X1 [Tanacetum coccineum]